MVSHVGILKDPPGGGYMPVFKKPVYNKLGLDSLPVNLAVKTKKKKKKKRNIWITFRRKP